MEDLSLHILDIVENSITAGASIIKIKIVEDLKKNLLQIQIADNGKGMDKDIIKKVKDPFFTTKPSRRVGLGISLLAQAAQESMGRLSIKSKKGEGTVIKANFQYNHIDRKPLGDIEKTLIVLIMGNPDIDFIFEHKRDNSRYLLDTRQIKKTLEGIPISHPRVIKYIKDDIRKWLNETKSSIL
jgi:anti-sigma regulatory factor (Ser/Thr protein kinase)